MLADHFTKPLQGELFRRFRAELMNISEDVDMGVMGWEGTEAKKGVSWKLHKESDPACRQECVGNYEKGTTIPDASALGGGCIHVAPERRNTGLVVQY